MRVLLSAVACCGLCAAVAAAPVRRAPEAQAEKPRTAAERAPEPSTPAANLCLLAEQLWQRGYHASAKAFIGRAASLQDGPTVRFWAGHLCYETGDLAHACEHFRQAVKLAPDSAETKLYLAAALNASRKKQEAHQLLEELTAGKTPQPVGASAREALQRLDHEQVPPWVLVVDPRRPCGPGRGLSLTKPSATLVPAPANAQELAKISAACKAYRPHAVRLAYLAARLAPEDPTVRLAYAQALFAYGRGPEGVEHAAAAVRLAGQGPAAAETRAAAEKLLAAHPELELEPPDKLVEPGFLVRYRNGDPSIPNLVKALRQARKTIRGLLGLEVDEVYVRVFPSREQFYAYSNLKRYSANTEWACAYARPTQMGLTTYLQRSLPIQQAGTIAHEYTHLALHQLTAGKWGVLGWLNEGMARLVETTYCETGAQGVVRKAAHRGELLTPAQLTLAFDRSDPVVAQLAYAQSERLANYLLHTRGDDALLWLLASLAQSKNESVTFAQIMGCTPDQLCLEWLQAGCP